jgi:hypothetical protein
MILDLQCRPLAGNKMDIRVNRDTAEFIARACRNQAEVPGEDIAFSIESAADRWLPRETTHGRSNS